MAGRRTFFSFHYQRDIWRVNVVRNASKVDAQSAAGWVDASLWEKAKAEGDTAIKRLINAGLEYTTVTVVLIGYKTSGRRWINYEIEQSIARGNGIIGVHINAINDQSGNADPKGAVPKLLVDNGIPCYNWDREMLGTWVERAAVKAGHSCLAHGLKNCSICGR